MSIVKKVVTALSAVAVLGFVLVSVIHMSKVNDNINKFREEYKLIEKDVSVFTKVSDPKTIQLYVKELNKILDEIHFLGRMVESGQLADEGLTAILNEQAKMNKKILEMVTIKAHNKTRDDIQDVRDATVGHIDDVYMEIEDIDDKLDRQYRALIKSLDIVEKEISDINKTLKTMNKKKFFHTHKD